MTQAITKKTKAKQNKPKIADSSWRLKPDFLFVDNVLNGVGKISS